MTVDTEQDSANRPDPDRPDPEVMAVLNRPGRRSRWRMAMVVVAVVVITAIVIWLATRGPRDIFETVPATTGPFVEEVTAVGTVEPLEMVEISSRQSGTVTSVEVEVNDPVYAGQVLARIDATPFEIAVTDAQARQEAAQAALDQARAQAAQARAHRDRTRRLVARDAATRVELEEAVTQAEVAEAQVDAAAAQLDQAAAALRRARVDLDESVITSPISGVVLQRQVEPGMTVISAMQAATLFVVASDLERMTAQVDIDEADIARVRPGQPATFTVTGWPDRTFPAVVVRVDLSPDPTAATVTYVAELHVDNRDLALRPGMTATATIETARLPDVTQVPVEALRYQPEDAEAPPGDHVWSLRNGVPVPVPVEVIGDDGTSAAVEGVAPGTPIIVGDQS